MVTFREKDLLEENTDMEMNTENGEGRRGIIGEEREERMETST